MHLSVVWTNERLRGGLEIAMRLPPGYRRPHSAAYWIALATVAGLTCIALAIAAAIADKPYQFIFVALFAYICVTSLRALREQHSREP